MSLQAIRQKTLEAAPSIMEVFNHIDPYDQNISMDVVFPTPSDESKLQDAALLDLPRTAEAYVDP